MKFKIIKREVIETRSTDLIHPPFQLQKNTKYDLFNWKVGVYLDEELQDTVGETWVFVNTYADKETAKRCAEYLSQIEKITPTLKTSSEEFEL